jgi:tripartite-type tricarboxylate transporter receptor subunit TctC
VGRILAARLSEVLGQQVVIENVGGAGGMTGVARVAKAPPDGYQFVLGGSDTFAQNQSLYKKPLYNAATDFEPVALLSEQALLLVVRNDFPANNLQEFIGHVKANNTKIQYGSAGLGSGSHLACAQATGAVGADVTHVPYRGSGPGLQDLLAGQIHYFCPLAAAATPHLTGKTMKAIAILTPERSPLMPEIPTAREQGQKDLVSYFWSAMFLPKGTPAAIVEKLNAAAVATLNTPAVQERLKGLSVTIVPPERRTPEYLKGFVSTEIGNWATTIKASGVSLD